MSADIKAWIHETDRDVRQRMFQGKPGYAAVARRTYAASAKDVWNAITEPENLKAWFIPVSGDLNAGGKFQLENHAGGEILGCARPYRLHLTWQFEDQPANEVVLTLTPEGDELTTLELEHSAAASEDEAPAHVLAVGVGWDPALVALGQYVTGQELDKQWWFESEDAKEFTKLSVDAWGDALKRRSVSDPKKLEKAISDTRQFYIQ